MPTGNPASTPILTLPSADDEDPVGVVCAINLTDIAHKSTEKSKNFFMISIGFK